VYNNNIILPSL